MTDVEQLLRATLQDYSGMAPEFTAIRPERPRRMRGLLVAPVVGVVCALALVAVFVWFDSRPQPSSDSTPADGLDTSELTGSDLARSLGLKPHFDGATHGCEATGYGQIAYCLDGVSDDPVERRVIGLQIQGYALNDALVRYAQIQEQIARVMDSGLSFRKASEVIEPYREQQAPLRDELVYIPPDVRGLTGEAAGDELGLAPMEVSDQPGCWAFAEYVHGLGFCFEKLTAGDKLASFILGRQINGHAPTELEADYLEAVLSWRTLNDQPLARDPEREAELWGQMSDLRAQLADTDSGYSQNRRNDQG